MKIYIPIILFWFVSIQEIAGQSPLFSYNLYSHNPAAISTQEWVSNVQYTGYSENIPGNLKDVDWNLQKRIPKLKGAVGFNFSDIVSGEGESFSGNLNLSYAYQWKLGNQEKSPNLNFGLQSGIFWGLFPMYDPNGSIGEYRGLGANLNLGVYFSMPKERFYAGFSVKDVLHPLWYQNNHPFYFHPVSYRFMTGYRFDIGTKYVLQPNVLLKMTSFYTDFDSNVQLQHKKWEVGANFGWGNLANYYFTFYKMTMVGMNMGICLKKRFSLRYFYYYPIQDGGVWGRAVRF